MAGATDALHVLVANSANIAVEVFSQAKTTLFYKHHLVWRLFPKSMIIKLSVRPTAQAMTAAPHLFDMWYKKPKGASYFRWRCVALRQVRRTYWTTS